MIRLISILLLGLVFTACGQTHKGKPALIMASKAVNDSFDIYITLPKNYNTKEKYNAFYYLDANIKSGNKLREIITDSVLKSQFSTTIFVGIGHRGDFHVLRRRDFTVPEIIGKDTFGLSSNFGQINRFYEFLKIELIPYINEHYHTSPDSNSLLGHSFGGLFTIYALFKNDQLFKNYYALSPSLWVSNYSIYNFNRLDIDSGFKKNVVFVSGGMEVLNKIKSGTDQLDTFLKNKKYNSLNFEYIIYGGETHNSAVQYAIRNILCN